MATSKAPEFSRSGSTDFWKSLQEMPEMVRLFIEQMPCVFWSTDLELRFTSSQGGGLASMGLAPGQVVGQTLVEFFGNSDHPCILAHRRALAGDSSSLEISFQDRSFECCVGPLLGAGGNIVGCAGVALDITHRKQVERDLQSSEERFRAFMAHLPASAWIKDSNFRYLYRNCKNEDQWFGLTEGWLGKDDFELWPQVAEQLRKNDLAVLNSGQAMEFTEGDLISQEGNKVHVVYKFPFTDASGKSYLGGMAVDISERLRSEKRLKESEDRFQLLAAHVSDVFWVADLRTQTVEYVSPAFQSIWGRDPQELFTRPGAWFDTLHPDDRAGVQEAFQQQLHTGLPQNLEYRILRPDGTIRTIRDRWWVIPDGSGQTARAVGIAQDVTEKKQAEETLWQSENRYRRIFESHMIGIVLWTPQGEVLEANDEYLRILGYSREDLEQGRINWRSVTVPEYLPLDERGIAEIFERGSCTPYEKEYVRKDGSRIQVLLGGAKLDGGGSTGVAFVLDLTEQSRAEAAAGILAAIVEGSQEAIIGKTLEGTITSWNRSAERIYGYTAEEILGRSAAILQSDPTSPELSNLLARISKGEVIPEFETLRRRKDGQIISVSLTLSPVRNKQGQIVGASGISQDITPRKRLEEQYRHAQKLEAVGRLAGGIAHDFNNLLTVINGYSQVMLGTLPEEDTCRPLVDQILKAGERAAGLTRQLLAFSRKQILQPKILDLNALIGDLGKMLPRLIGEDIQLELNLEPELRKIRADPGQIEQVMMNLAVNSRDAMPRGGRFFIRTQNFELGHQLAQGLPELRPGYYVLLEVADTGCGMDTQIRDRIFEPFFTTKEPGKGTGLGLAMVYGVVKQSGGHILVQSQPGQGTAFQIYFPSIEAPTRPPSMEMGTKGPGGWETILVVEDEEAVRALVRQMLHVRGYKVLEAGSAQEALDLASHYPADIHLLVSDVILPGISGRELAEQLNQFRPGMKVLFISGYTDDAIVRHGIVDKSAEFLQKPFSLETLAHRIRKILDAPATS